jgi:hypothetical protein
MTAWADSTGTPLRLRASTVVGMRDQPALAVDHVGVAVAADPDLRDDVPDELEVDVGDRHTAAPAMHHRHGEVGLAAFSEIDRPVIDLVGLGLDEGGVVRAVGVAADHVHAEPRDVQLLVAGAVELGQLGDRRHLAQQADIVEAALLGRQGVELGVGHPADLALDLLDERFDRLRGRDGLLALHVDRGLAVVAIDEVEVERGVDHADDGHQADEQGDVFEEETALHRSPLTRSPDRPATGRPAGSSAPRQRRSSC